MEEFAKVASLVRNGARICTHSGKVRTGDIFVALNGSRVDGSQYLEAACANGAIAAIVQQDVTVPEQNGMAIVRVKNPRVLLGQLARIMYGTEERLPKVIGVTGTNGKTTTVHLLDYLFERNGVSSGVIGTVMTKWGGKSHPAAMTTPDCLSLHETLGQMVAAGVQVLSMEVSSHALDQERIAGVPVDIGVFSNLTQDHLDYHHDMERYFAAKSRLFIDDAMRCTNGVVNADDAYGRRLLDIRPDLQGYGIENEAWLRGQIIDAGPWGMTMRMRCQGREWDLKTGLVGTHNAYNLLACQAAGLTYGLSVAQLLVLKDAPCAPGRLERVPNAAGLDIFIDYAHTPDALEKVSSSLKNMGFKRLVTVFGCGGDRDATKRPLMGRAVAKYADIAVVTSDNPRSENPESIIDQIMPGLAGAAAIIRDADRREAIGKALAALQKGDALLIAGKGHEDYQVIGTEKIHFSDFEVVRELLR